MEDSSRKANEHNVVVFDAIDLCLQQREIAGFIFAGDVHDRVVVSRPIATSPARQAASYARTSRQLGCRAEAGPHQLQR